MYYIKRNWVICRENNFKIQTFESFDFKHEAVDAVRQLNKETEEDQAVVVVISKHETICLLEVTINNDIQSVKENKNIISRLTNHYSYTKSVPFWVVYSEDQTTYCNSHMKAKKVFDELVVENLKNNKNQKRD